jgi:hypothetical protein
MAMMPSATAGNPYENDPVIEQDLIDPDGVTCLMPGSLRAFC